MCGRGRRTRCDRRTSRPTPPASTSGRPGTSRTPSPPCSRPPRPSQPCHAGNRGWPGRESPPVEWSLARPCARCWLSRRKRAPMSCPTPAGSKNEANSPGTSPRWGAEIWRTSCQAPPRSMWYRACAEDAAVQAARRARSTSEMPRRPEGCQCGRDQSSDMAQSVLWVMEAEVIFTRRRYRVKARCGEQGPPSIGRVFRHGGSAYFPSAWRGGVAKGAFALVPRVRMETTSTTKAAANSMTRPTPTPDCALSSLPCG